MFLHFARIQGARQNWVQGHVAWLCSLDMPGDNRYISGLILFRHLQSLGCFTVHAAWCQPNQDAGGGGREGRLTALGSAARSSAVREAGRGGRGRTAAGPGSPAPGTNTSLLSSCSTLKPFNPPKQQISMAFHCRVHNWEHAIVTSDCLILTTTDMPVFVASSSAHGFDALTWHDNLVMNRGKGSDYLPNY